MISATNYFLGDKIAEVTSTLAKVTYEEIIKLAKVHDDDVNSASNVEVNQVDGIRSKHHVEELSHLKVEGSINLDKVDRDEIMSPSNEEINQVFETSSKPMEEISPMKVDAGSTSTHCEVVETNITDHGEAKDEDVKADLARDDKGELEVLSSFSDECDLINHIPLVDQGFFDDLKK